MRSSSNLAIISLVSGILGWTVVPFIGSVIAVITGHLARAEIRREPERLDGDGMAVAGLILGYTLLAFTILVVALMILFFGGLAVLLGWLGINGHLS